MADTEQDSTPRQERACRAFASTRSLQVVEVFEDVDLSAFRPGVRRPAYEELLRAVAARRFDAVIVFRLDRLVRRPAEFERFWAVCESTQTRILSVNEPVDTSTAIGLAVVRMLVTFAGLESTVRSERLKAKNRDDALKGRPPIGPRRFGYANDKLTIVSAEADAIREAADRVLRGEPVSAVARNWNEQGLTTSTGTCWKTSGVSRVLQSRYLVGEREYDGEVVATGAWPPILDRLTGAMLRNILSTVPAGVHRYPLSGGLLSGRLRCGNCGTVLYYKKGKVEGITTSGEPTIGKAPIYKCSHATGCRGISIRADVLDEWVTAQLHWRLASRALPHRRRKRARATSEAIRLLDRHREALKKLNVTYYMHARITYREYIAARDALLDVTERAVHDVAPEWRPPGVPTDLTLVELVAAWEDLALPTRRGILGIEL